MHPIVRSVLGVIAGVVIGFVLIFAIEALGQIAFPPPPDVEVHDFESLKAAMSQGKIPIGSMAAVLVAYAVGTFFGTFLAALIVGRAHLLHALIVAGFFFLANITNLLTIPHPIWFAVASVCLFPVAGAAGGWLGKIIKPENAASVEA